MTCPEEIELSAYLDGELDGATLEAVAEHLLHCEACRAKVDAMRAADDAAGRLMEALGAGRRPKLLPQMHKPWKPIAWAAAAGLLVTAGLVAYTSVRDYSARHLRTVAGAVKIRPALRPEDLPWLRLDNMDESYEDFVKRVTSERRVPVDELDAAQAESLRRELLLARGMNPQTNG